MTNVNTLVPIENQQFLPNLFSAEEMHDIMFGAYADSTVRNKQYLLEKYNIWLDSKGYTSLDNVLLLGIDTIDQLTTKFLDEMFEGVISEKPLSPAYIGQAYSTICWYLKYRNNGNAVPLPLSEMKMKRIKREGRGRGRGQRNGLTWEQVDNICTLLESDDTSRSLRNSLILRVMSDALLRVSEIPPLNIEDFDGNGVIIRSSKTDQEGKGAHQYLCDKTRAVLKTYKQRVGITEGALFIRFTPVNPNKPHVDKHTGEWKRISSFQVRYMIKQEAKRIGIEERVSGHSLRIGSAVSLASKGATLVDMQLAGRWKSADMPAHYAKSQLSERGAVARLKDGK